MFDTALGSLDQFISEVRRIPMYSEEDRLHLAALARQGDSQARETLIQSLLPILVKYAKWYLGRCRHFSLLDLVHIGCESVLQWLDHALQAPCPPAYLCLVARKEMWNACLRRDSLVALPKEAEPYTFVSLDKPLNADDPSSVLANVLPAPAVPSCEERRDYGVLYEALSRLSEDRRILLARRYGLLGYTPTPREELAREMFPDLPERRAQATFYGREQRALAALQVLLSASYMPEVGSVPDEYYTRTELEERFGITRSQLCYWIEQRYVTRYPAPAGLPGKSRYVYAKNEIDALLQQRGRVLVDEYAA